MQAVLSNTKAQPDTGPILNCTGASKQARSCAHGHLAHNLARCASRDHQMTTCCLATQHSVRTMLADSRVKT
eukprot:6207205-Pleurochrysis_carterae.AAC.2